MISLQELQKCYDLLYIYDVEQKGWEQEPNSFTANAAHTLTHLVKDGHRKDFVNAELASKAIAPDNLMYALRFIRWGNLDSNEVLGLAKKQESSNPKWLHAEAVSCLAELLHEEDHASAREQAISERVKKLAGLTALLVASADAHARECNVRLEHAFRDRLQGLRVRFNIPEVE